jgi:hypothetical protein
VIAPSAAVGTTLFWHVDSPWPALQGLLATLAAWTMTARLTREQRGIWLALAALGLVAAWVAPPLWEEPDKLAWAAALR